MTRYDLGEFQSLTWVRAMRWLRMGCATFGVIAAIWVGYGAFLQLKGGRLDSLHIVADALAFFILGCFLFVGLAGRGAASGLVIDGTGVQLIYSRGRPDFREWDDTQIILRGRRTDGVGDSIFRGRALWSIFGRFGGLSETFIPKSAFDELVGLSGSHGLILHESRGRPGWFLYTIKRS